MDRVNRGRGLVNLAYRVGSYVGLLYTFPIATAASRSVVKSQSQRRIDEMDPMPTTHTSLYLDVLIECTGYLVP